MDVSLLRGQDVGICLESFFELDNGPYSREGLALFQRDVVDPSGWPLVDASCECVMGLKWIENPTFQAFVRDLRLEALFVVVELEDGCLLYTSPSPRD